MWWEKYGWKDVHKDLLAPNGLIIQDAKSPIVAGWMFLTDGKWGILEWIIGNPDRTREDRQKALDVLIPALIGIAKQSGKSIIFSSIKNGSLMDAYLRNGMLKSDEGMTNFIKVVE